MTDEADDTHLQLKEEGVAAPSFSVDQQIVDGLRLLGHDMRAAVSDVIGGLRLIDADRLDPDMQTQMARIRVAAETLAQMMDSTLSLVEGQVAGETVGPGFAFRSFLAEIEHRWAGRAAEQGLVFRLDVDRNVPEQISVARLNLDRILGNLIANAMKFTDQGEVQLTVRVKDDRLEFRVRDQGQGFSETALERLFSEEGRPQDSNRPGTGLGLHISKELATALGGDLEVFNLVDGGAIVTLTIPSPHWCRHEGGSDVPDLSDMSVLVAEDNETNQILVRQMLETMGARMVLARDGVEALEAIQRDVFDIALVDIEMPRKTGMEVMNELRQRPGFDVPMVALTAYVMRDNREAIYAAGADGVIAKPIRSITAFGEAIQRHVDKRGGAVATVMPDKISAQMLAEIDRNRFESILQSAGPDGRDEFMEHLVADLRAIAQNLRAALVENDAMATQAQTHILISLAGAIGAERLQEMAESLNAAVHRARPIETQGIMGPCIEALDILIEDVEARWHRASRH